MSENQANLSKHGCGSDAELITHWAKGVANRKHYFVRCKNKPCRTRTRDRRTSEGAVADWNTIFVGHTIPLNKEVDPMPHTTRTEPMEPNLTKEAIWALE